ncbi:PIN domain-containing protein [Litorihabitans aurantiacus]|uniref:PIN domain-containing protein n=1 Tax=Litorihabitans aurantiacus TaxID=1930061 RepID=UPI0024E166D3|nr:PIN domain-containing protein [Litorihabitans aurantiacus]
MLDTSTLPRRASIRDNPLLSALLRIAKATDIKLCITDVILEESTSARRRAAEQAISELKAAVRKLGSLHEESGGDLYIPSVEEIVERWEGDLRSSFSILETAGEDARLSLLREANRIPPARASGDSAIGSRDASIWLTAKRAAGEQRVLLVSGNTSDFAGTNGLRQELEEELSEGELVAYSASVDATVSLLAESVIPIARDVSDVNAWDGDSDILMQATNFVIASTDETLDYAYGQIDNKSMEVRREYAFPGGRLALIALTSDLKISPLDLDPSDAGSRNYPIIVDFWVLWDDDESTSIDVDRIRHDSSG